MLAAALIASSTLPLASIPRRAVLHKVGLAGLTLAAASDVRN